MQHLGSTSKGKRYFLIYTTANETDYSIDYANISAMCRLHPGVDKLELLIVVSEVDKSSTKDETAFLALRRIIARCSWLVLQGVISKSNVGRDFSSAQAGLREVAKLASGKDEVMVRNRSAYGPFTTDWYVKYSSMLDDQIGLVGNTINQGGHPDHEYEEGEVLCHVQTYIYVSRFSILDKLIASFPGVGEADRLFLIKNGELQLSREIMDQGLYLVSLHWPKHRFGNGNYNYSDLPTEDVKDQVLGLPFEHRKSGIEYPSLKTKFVWRLRRLMAFMQFLKNKF